MDIQSIVHLAVGLIVTTLYFLLFFYQKNLISANKGHIETLEKAFNTYKSMVSFDDYEKNTNLKIENIQLEHEFEVNSLISDLEESYTENGLKPLVAQIMSLSKVLAVNLSVLSDANSPQMNEMLDEQLSDVDIPVRNAIKNLVVIYSQKSQTQSESV